MSEPAKKAPRPKPKPVKPVEPPVEDQAPATSPTPVPSAADLRRRRARRVAIRLALGVGVPTLLAAIYYGFVATPQYESSSSFTIQSADTNAPANLELLIASVPGSSAARDVLLVQSYVQSRDMLHTLVDEHGFVEHYADPNVDYLSRLDSDASFEEVYEYYVDSVVDTEHDSQAGSVTLRVRAFSADKATEIARALLDASEEMVNRMMQQARQDRIDLATHEVERAEERLSEARRQILELQGERAEINPQASAEALLSVRSSLEGELASARADLNAMRATLQPGTPQLVAQQQRVAALARQVEAQTQRLAAGGREEGLSEDIAAFEPAVAEKEYAQRAYESALTSLEMARLEASRQHRYLVTIASPSHPDEATHPRPFLAILTVFVLSFALVSIGSLLLASMREHANL